MRKNPTTSKWAAHYKDSRWQKLRLKVMERDNWTCQNCDVSGEGETLNVHHIYYESGKRPWEYDDSVLITWCEDCHKTIHETQKVLLQKIAMLGACIEGGSTAALAQLIGYVDALTGFASSSGVFYELGFARASVDFDEFTARGLTSFSRIKESDKHREGGAS